MNTLDFSLEAALDAQLSALPPFSAELGYTVVRGNPRASMRLWLGTASSDVRVGIWECTEGAFECIEFGDELQTLVCGQLTLRYPDGSSESYGPGDSIFTRKGERVTWDIEEDVRKVFFTLNPDALIAE